VSEAHGESEGVYSKDSKESDEASMKQNELIFETCLLSNSVEFPDLYLYNRTQYKTYNAIFRLLQPNYITSGEPIL